LSLWNMQNPSYDRWKGYQPKGVDTILKSGKIPPEVGIAMSRIYRDEEAKKITEAQHPAAIWGWYLADNELTYTMHVHTHVMQEFFKQLPPGAGERVFFYSLDNCQRETNIYSIYVAARMLWYPKGDPEQYLREIARLVYGPKLEEPVFRALKTIADVRCGKNCRAYYNPKNGLGLEDGYKQATDAWDALKDAAIDPSYIPPVKFHRSPQVLLEELKGHIQVVAMYMQFLKDKQEGKPNPREVPQAPGPFESYERLQYLQQRTPVTAP